MHIAETAGTVRAVRQSPPHTAHSDVGFIKPYQYVLTISKAGECLVSDVFFFFFKFQFHEIGKC